MYERVQFSKVVPWHFAQIAKTKMSNSATLSIVILLFQIDSSACFDIGNRSSHGPVSKVNLLPTKGKPPKALTPSLPRSKRGKKKVGNDHGYQTRRTYRPTARAMPKANQVSLQLHSCTLYGLWQRVASLRRRRRLPNVGYSVKVIYLTQASPLCFFSCLPCCFILLCFFFIFWVFEGLPRLGGELGTNKLTSCVPRQLAG